ncbi:dihydrolipoamide acetyltransferase family protein [Novosphingopyxis sp. YJ-S2-01]|uniref:dihydrolipoamide acetyltransferase family protein n=1 Tax=Novosphingopyxis sp. YJ-S2-01 TaxID=2794021 RepID=UPI0018DDC2AE|nr:dihydrolipoamide acetyltransferase family protein [Novosphingopyxis sp. YJ-S2-01]MBH9538143.1 2-oxo acid dehydrogenase subunit E2 [Novosphingopyxis sp. YJ-S2-01]
MGRYTFNLPDIGEGIAEAEIVEWHVSVGDMVEEDQQIADMMTDKATVEMEAPVAGKIVEVAGEAGDTIPIGSMLVVIETEGEVEDDGHGTAERTDDQPADKEGVAEAADAGPGMDEKTVAAEDPGVQDNQVDTPRTEVSPKDGASIPAKEDGVASESEAEPKEGEGAKTSRGTDGDEKKVLASPAVRKRAEELGVDLADVKHQGEHIRHGDLDAYLNYGSGQGYRPAGASAKRENETIKVIGMRRKIAQNMAASKRSIPHFTYVEELDVTELEHVRAELNATRGSKPKLTVLPLLIVAIAKTIPDFPMINARYDDEEGVVTRHGAIHLGMAAQTDKGLTVPVIRNAQDRNVWQLASEIDRLANAARDGSIKADELQGATLTLTSLGPLGGIATTPVINKPEVAIIGPNKIVERPVIVDGELEARKLMNLSISCDHRVVDGWDAASFVQALKKLVETPVLLFAD